MSDFLRQMAASSAERAAAVPALRSEDLDRPLAPLSADGFDVIAEIKNRSPAEGALAGPDSDRLARAQVYARAGAAAISVLTEPSRFDGSLSHLEEVAAAVPGTPVMRKDFLVDPVQVDEARAAGASGVLLIVAMLDDTRLRAMLDRSLELGMFVLLEAFDREDLVTMRRLLAPADLDAASSGRLLFGVNSRNLRTLAVDANRLADFVADLPRGPRVAESGLATAEDAERVARYGYSMALVGTALMRSDDPAGLIGAMRSAGRSGIAA
jgi:indole-3-glycerol phosphate synthase